MILLLFHFLDPKTLKETIWKSSQIYPLASVAPGRGLHSHSLLRVKLVLHDCQGPVCTRAGHTGLQGLEHPLQSLYLCCDFDFSFYKMDNGACP